MKIDVKLKTWGIWLFFTVGVSIISGLSHYHRTVTHAYRRGALAWLHGTTLYMGPRGFIYFPQSAILYIPFAKLSIPISLTLWCFVSVAVFSYGLYRLTEFTSAKYRHQFFLLMTVFVIPVAFSDARNGQMNLIMAGLMFLSAVAVSKQQWNKTAFLLVVGFALKPIIVVLLLLYAAIYPRLIWRFALGIVAMLALPFLTQDSHYVWRQYIECVVMLQQAASLGSAEHTHWAQLFSLLAQGHLIVSTYSQDVIRVLAAIGTLLLAFVAKRRFEPQQLPLWVLMLAICYLMLFNPRTENNTYVLLACVMAYCLADAWIVAQQKMLALCYGVLIVGIVFGSNISEFFIPGQQTWVTPLIGVIFSSMLIIQVIKKKPILRNGEVTACDGV